MNDQLLQRIKRCPSLPSLPTIAVQVLDLTQEPNINLPELAVVIANDPAMSGKVLKTANSSFYGRTKPATTINQALIVLGLQSVRTLVLGFSLVNNLKESGGGDGGRGAADGFDHMAYWRRSIYAATAARCIAGRVGLGRQAEEVFLAALLMDVGQLVLDKAVGPAYGPACAAAGSHDALSAAEQAAVGGTHAEVGGVIAALWKLPPTLAVPMARHHDSPSAVAAIPDEDARRLTQLVALAGRCADVFVDADPAAAMADVRRRAADVLGADVLAPADPPPADGYSPEGADAEADGPVRDGVDVLLAEIAAQTKEAASLFEINLGAGDDPDGILRQANDQLVEITLQSQLQATELRHQNDELQKAATTDALTGLANRARFDAFLAERFAAARAAGQPLSLLLMDVDRFKLVNDRHGHPAGDAVLRSLGKLLRTAARDQDLAARYGGEELCLVLAGTGKKAAAAIADVVRRAVAARPVKAATAGGVDLSVTVSIGVAVFDPAGPLRDAGHLVKAADLAVYAAKHSGRNCVRVFTLPPTAAAKAA